MGFPGGSVVKNQPVNGGDVGWILGREDAPEKEVATHSSILAWETHGQRSLPSYNPWGHKRVKHGLATKVRIPVQEPKCPSQWLLTRVKQSTNRILCWQVLCPLRRRLYHILEEAFPVWAPLSFSFPLQARHTAWDPVIKITKEHITTFPPTQGTTVSAEATKLNQIRFLFFNKPCLQVNK